MLLNSIQLYVPKLNKIYENDVKKLEMKNIKQHKHIFCVEYSWINDMDRQDQGNIFYWEINIDLVWKVAFEPNCTVKQCVQTKYLFSFDVNCGIQ